MPPVPAPPSQAPDDKHRRLTLALLGLCVLAITHGSLYPWVFVAPAGGWIPAWHRLWGWTDRPLWTNTGDVIGNVILFVPLGMLAWRASESWRSSRWLRWLVITALSLVFALALQVAQIWLPTRSAAVSDAVWNALGLVLGYALAGWAQAPIAWLSKRLQSPHLLAYLAALFWLALQWWPLLPMLHRTVIRMALAHLRNAGRWEPLPTVLAACALLVVMHLLRGLRGRAWVAIGLVAAAQLGHFIFVQKAGSTASETSTAVGWVLGLALGGLAWRLSVATANRAVLMAAVTAGVLSALQPFQLLAVPAPVQLLPFAVLWSEPRVAHTSAFLWDAFWIASVLLLGHRQGWRLARAAAVLTLAVAVLEAVQRWLPGQQADITALLLPAAFAWLLARLLRRHERLHPHIAFGASA